MTILFRTGVLILVTLLGIPAGLRAASAIEGLAQLQTTLSRLRETHQQAEADTALRIGKEILDRAGVDWESAALGGRRTLRIRSTVRSVLNRSATACRDEVWGLTLHFDPGLFLTHSASSAGYDTDLHSISFAAKLEEFLAGRSSTLAHELLHARLSYQVYRLGKESILGAQLVIKNKARSPGDPNPYVECLNLQELVAYAEGYAVELANARSGSEVDREELRSRILKELSRGMSWIVHAVGRGAADLANDLSGSTAMSPGSGEWERCAVLKPYVIENKDYALRIWLKEPPADKEACARAWLAEARALATRVDEILGRGRETLGGQGSLDEFGAVVDEWKAVAGKYCPR